MATSTTEPDSPVETYEKRLRGRIDVEARPGGLGSGDGYAELVELGQQICDLMSTADEAAVESSTSDAHESDALRAVVAESAVDIARTALRDDRIVAVFLRTTTYYLCHEHETLIETQLDSLGL